MCCYNLVFADAEQTELLAVLYWDDYETADEYAAALAALQPAFLQQVNWVLMSVGRGCPLPKEAWPKRWRDAAAVKAFDRVFTTRCAWVDNSTPTNTNND